MRNEDYLLEILAIVDERSAVFTLYVVCFHAHVVGYSQCNLLIW